MGLLDALSAGIGAAAPAGAALAQGQAQATQSNTGFLEKLAAMQQAKQKADMDRQVAQAQIGHLGAETKSLLNPPVKQKEAYNVPGVGLVVQDDNGNWKVKVATTEKPATPAKYSPVTVTGPDGKPMVGRFNNLTGQIEDTGFGKPAAAGKAGMGGGTLQQKASLEAGYKTLKQADADATAYEDMLLKNPEKAPGAIAGTLGAFADPASHHDIGPAAGGLLNYVDKDYSKYAKSLSAAANAGMLISQRPSDVRMKKENYLAGVTSNPTVDQIQQARQWRKDMIGAFESVLTDGQGQGAGQSTGSNVGERPLTATISPSAAPPAASNASQFGAYGQFVPRKTP